MVNFERSPKLAIVIYAILLSSCLTQITVELGFHEFDSFASHHGMAIFALGGIIDNWNSLRQHFFESTKPSA